MNTRLVYVVGPSGAGKDSVLSWLVSQPSLKSAVHWATRDVTREGHESSQRDCTVSPQTFACLQAQGAYALWWQANGLSYGVRHEAMAPFERGQWLLLNGSRRHLSAALAQYPGLTVLHITADAELLRQRLIQRGREQGQAVQTRLATDTSLNADPQLWGHSRVLRVLNNGSLEEAGRQAWSALRQLPGWPEMGAGMLSQ